MVKKFQVRSTNHIRNSSLDNVTTSDQNLLRAWEVSFSSQLKLWYDLNQRAEGRCFNFESLFMVCLCHFEWVSTHEMFALSVKSFSQACLTYTPLKGSRAKKSRELESNVYNTVVNAEAETLILTRGLYYYRYCMQTEEQDLCCSSFFYPSTLAVCIHPVICWPWKKQKSIPHVNKSDDFQRFLSAFLQPLASIPCRECIQELAGEYMDELFGFIYMEEFWRILFIREYINCLSRSAR